jgi:tryptophan synthase beta chain
MKKNATGNNPGRRYSYKPDSLGYYGEYGGRYAPEVLVPALEELEAAFEKAKRSKSFRTELAALQRDFVGRPSPLLFCENLSKKLGGAKIFIKNEGCNLTGAHKINHCIGQILLARNMGKRRIIAETGAGQHGLATATVCAKFGMECVVYMGATDVSRQRPNVFWMEQLGATVVSVEHGGKRLKDAVNAALKDWIANVKTSHYLLGSALGPHPFPEINRYFQAIVGREIRQQMNRETGHLPDYVIACVGGGSNAAGAFDEFLPENKVSLIGVEAGGKGLSSGKHAVRLQGARIGIVEGYKSFWLQNQVGQVADTHSISAGLDYAGVGPLHAWLKDRGRVTYTYATDTQALEAVRMLALSEGVIPALESAHALAEAIRLAPTLSARKNIVVNISGRGDKDIFILAGEYADESLADYLESFSQELRKNLSAKRTRKVGHKR